MSDTFSVEERSSIMKKVRSVAEIESEIDTLLIEISDAEDALKVTDERHAQLSDELIKLSDNLSESLLLYYSQFRKQHSIHCLQVMLLTKSLVS